MNYTKYCNANEILEFINTFSQNLARKMYENATKLGRFVKLIAKRNEIGCFFNNFKKICKKLTKDIAKSLKV